MFCVTAAHLRPGLGRAIIGTDAANLDGRPWYEGITSYQWLVLLIASLGWIFDVFEGQIFVASMNRALSDLTPEGTPESTLRFYEKLANGAFLVGGAIGGVGFGILSDRIGRIRTMIYTILMYSCFTFATVFATEWWHMVGLRFLVALGVGGEWAVASALVAEVFPTRARAWSLGIFHASSVIGTYLAILVRWQMIENPEIDWRWAFVVGALPAMLTVWIRMRLHEPEKWVEARDVARRGKRVAGAQAAELLPLLRRTALGVSLATVGLATFWGIHIYGKDIQKTAARNSYLREAAAQADSSEVDEAEVLDDHAPELERAETIGMFLTTTGGGLGLILFGPLCEWLGRRGAFLLFHLGGFLATVAMMTYLPIAESPAFIASLLPFFGLMTLGMHAGYAIYFPELFPTRLRGTGAGLCFNGGRLTAAVVLVVVGYVGQLEKLDFTRQALILSSLFLIGAVLLLFAPETKGRELPE